MLEIEIVYGTAEKQILRSIRIEQGATARTAVRQSGLDKDFPELDLNAAPLGIFGKRVKDDVLLRDRDRTRKKQDANGSVKPNKMLEKVV